MRSLIILIILAALACVARADTTASVVAGTNQLAPGYRILSSLAVSNSSDATLRVALYDAPGLSPTYTATRSTLVAAVGHSKPPATNTVTAYYKPITAFTIPAGETGWVVPPPKGLRVDKGLLVISTGTATVTITDRQ